MATATEKSTAAAPVASKKGNPSWRPATDLGVVKKRAGWRYRWVNANDPLNLDRKLAEGWVYADSTQGAQAEHRHNDINAGKDRKQYRELVLMALPEALAKERDRYFAEQTRKQTVGVKEKLRRDLEKAAREHGTIPADVYGQTTNIE